MTDWNRVTKPAATWTCWPEPSPRVAPAPWYKHLCSALHEENEHLARAMELSYSPALFKRLLEQNKELVEGEGPRKAHSQRARGLP